MHYTILVMINCKYLHTIDNLAGFIQSSIIKQSPGH